MARISVENVQIKTASVEIKTLTVSGRQLTLSVFRQIPEVELIDFESMTLKGIPWGEVNYFWGDNGCAENCLHIVWQKGVELKRSVIVRNYKHSAWHGNHRSQIKDMESELRIFTDKECAYDHSYDPRCFKSKNIHFLEKSITCIAKALHENDFPFYSHIFDNLQSKKEGEENLIIEGHKLNEAIYEHGLFADKLNESKRIFNENSLKLKSLTESIASLPQIFIAI